MLTGWKFWDGKIILDYTSGAHCNHNGLYKGHKRSSSQTEGDVTTEADTKWDLQMLQFSFEIRGRAVSQRL